MGVDILDYFTGERSWHEFYDFIQELPSHGKFHSAMAMDEDFAKMLHKRLEEEKPDWDEEEPDQTLHELRSPEGYDPKYQLMVAMDEHLQALMKVTVSLHSKSKAPDIHPHPRPFTAYDNLELYAARDRMRGLAQRVGMRTGNG